MRKHILVSMVIVITTMILFTIISLCDIEDTNEAIQKENNAWLALVKETDDEANNAALLFKTLISNDENIDSWERHDCMVKLARLDDGYYFKEYSFNEAVEVMIGEREVDGYISPMIPLTRDCKYNLMVSFSFGGIYLFLVVAKIIFFKEDKKVK